MKTPISYYGGKQRLVPEILPLFPPHNQYVEPFTGGGAVFFAKKRSKHEVINDLDKRLVNFYRVVKDEEKFLKLQEMIRGTLHSEYDYLRSKQIVAEPMKDEIEFAWALWFQTNCTFSHIIGGGFAFANTDNAPKLTNNKKKDFELYYCKRLERVEIFNRDAVELIKLKDGEDVFFYCDPPYVSSDCGHYDGYTMDHFRTLLDTLKNIKGKFLMSSYPEELLMEYRRECGWNYKDIEARVMVTGKREGVKMKTECLTWNYELTTQLDLGLFDEIIETENENES
jgi:DNA adenine methylase